MNRLFILVLIAVKVGYTKIQGDWEFILL